MYKTDNYNQKKSSSNLSFFIQFFIVFITLGSISYFLFDQSPAAIIRKRVEHGKEEEYLKAFAGEGNGHDTLRAIQRRETFLGNFNENILNANRVFVIPGGGGTGGYPEWTKQRVVAAYSVYANSEDKSNIFFLALSAGSLNSANSKYNDGRIVFECQHMINHLAELGVPRDIILGDFMSWDTVSNGIYLRHFMEGLRMARKIALDDKTELEKKSIIHTGERDSIDLEVFVSDFHSERVKFVFDWILELHPPISKKQPYSLIVNSVSSKGIQWGAKEHFQKRVEHEQLSISKMKSHSTIIENIEELYSYVLLGGHKGFNNYFHENYEVSEGAGW
jgi:hypothetical protein